MGSFAAGQVAALVSVAFALLCAVTALLAIFPGTDPVPTDDSDDSDIELELDFNDPHNEPDDKTDATTQRSTHAASDRRAHHSDSDIIEALRRTATRLAVENRAIEEHRDAALAQVADLKEQLAAYETGTAPEQVTFEARCREEATIVAFQQVRELSDAAERQTQALKEARAHAEAEARTAREELAAALEQITSARRAGAADEYQRLSLAVRAVNDTSIDFLDPLQREAVERHAQRIRDAVDRLAPEEDTEGPDVVMPPMEHQPANEAKPKRSSRRRNRSRRPRS